MNLRSILATSFFIFALDRFTKSMAMSAVSLYEIFSWLSWDTTLNTGISWGMLQKGIPQEVFILCNVVLLVSLVFWITKSMGYVPWYVAFIVTGALSNLLDRVMYGGVVDFISVRIFGWQYPIFNVADCAIVLGIGCMFFISIVGGDDDE